MPDLDPAELYKLAQPVTRYEAPTSCAVADCTEPHHKTGLCSRHYMKLYHWRKANDMPRIRQDYSNVTTALPATYKRDHADTCTITNCERPYSARGLCRMHYNRHLRATK